MIKECIRCKLAINTAEERHVVVKDNQGKDNINTLYYHKQCWHEVMTGKGALNNMIQKAQKIFGVAEDKLDINKEKVYEVKP